MSFWRLSRLALLVLATLATPSRRKLQLSEFRSWSLTAPVSSNAISYTQQATTLFVKAGVPYSTITLHASSNLATNESLARLKIVLATATSDADCIPGGSHEAYDIVWSEAPSATSLDGLTDADTAVSYQNIWSNVRFPRGGVFQLCYMDLSLNYWRLVDVDFDASGILSSTTRFWCIASDANCQMYLVGRDIRTSWRLTVQTSSCDSTSFFPAFDLNISNVSAEVQTAESVNVHSLGGQLVPEARTYIVCYCTGYNPDGVGSFCTEPEDFVQQIGLLHTTSVVPKQTPHPQLRFDLQVFCGGGCPLTGLRLKLVDPIPANDRPSFDPLNGCRTAPQAASYLSPINCASPTSCTLAPSVASVTVPEWSNFQVSPAFENRAQVPVTYDVCLCLGTCETAANWFKVGAFSTSVLQLLPNPMMANKVMDFQVYGPDAGWNSASSEVEMKILYDPLGEFEDTECFTRSQDSSSLAGHFCLSNTDCKAPLSSPTGRLWQNLRIFYAGMYTICYCEQGCFEASQWSLLRWQLVTGPSPHQTWRRFRGLLFDLPVSGWGLSSTNRLSFVSGNAACGLVSSGLQIPDVPPNQVGNMSGSGLLSMQSVYDGLEVSCTHEHQMSTADSVSFSGVESSVCSYCAELLNSRPHRIIRVPTSTQFVLQLTFENVPDFQLDNASYVRSNEAVFQDIVADSPGSYTICWSATPSSNPMDFAASAGLLTVLEPPLFEALVHNTATQAGAIAPAIVAFTTQNHPEYRQTGESRLLIRFPHLDMLVPEGPQGTTDETSLEDATQSNCGRIIREIWSDDADGFPMPKGCYYRRDATSGTNFREYALVFSASNGLKSVTHYQLVLSISALLLPGSFPPSDGHLQLWSMRDNADPFGVIEYAPAWLQQQIVEGSSGTQPHLHPSGGVTLLGDDVLDLTQQGVAADISMRLRAKAGASIVQGNRLVIYLWPLTQWNLAESCSAGCDASALAVTGCDSPSCSVTTFVNRRSVLNLVFAQMDPITNSVQHTIRLLSLLLPSEGFFGSHFGAELEAAAAPSYQSASGALLFASPFSMASVISSGDKPFRGDEENHLLIRLMLSATVWGGHQATPAPVGANSVQSVAGLEVNLPEGYACVGADPPFEMQQGYGVIGLDDQLDGYWLFSGRLCIYALNAYSVVYANSAIVVNLTVNNPSFALPMTDPSNVWSVRLRGTLAPGNLPSSAVEVRSSAQRNFAAAANAPVLGVLRDATLTPEYFGITERNWLSIFFTTEQSCPDNGGALQLLLPSGFLVQPRCLTRSLPEYHYASVGFADSIQRLPVLRCLGNKNSASIVLPSTASFVAGRSYAFQIQVLNAATYTQEQHDNFRLTTQSAAGNSLDGTLNSLRYVASDPQGSGNSFGVYQLAMPPGSFMLTFDNLLPYSQMSQPTRVVVFPLKVPFDSMDEISWRIVAPLGYIWDFNTADFLYRRQDILGVTADLPLSHVPAVPLAPAPLAVLNFVHNFQGTWDRLQTYGFVAKIRVPDTTPRSSSNFFLVEFGFDSLSSERFAAAATEAPEVRTLVNFMVDYFLTSLLGKENILQIHFQSVTALMAGGYFLIDAPMGFAIEANCAVLESLALEEPFQDLAASGAGLQCSSSELFANQHVQVTISVSSGTVAAAAYSFGLSARNPLVPEEGGLLWTISSFRNTQELADLSSTVEGFQVETPMAFGALLGLESGINYAATGRDDHPGQVTHVILAFELASTPTFTGSAALVVKAPPGFQFPSLCTVMVTGEIFGVGIPFPAIYKAFDSSAVVSSCQGQGRRAELQIGLGLRSQRRYVMRLATVNPEETPAQNTWTISFSDEATEPFDGYRFWRFTELAVTPSAKARSTLAEETFNNVSIVFRTTNALSPEGFIAIQAPFGFRIPTSCHASLVDTLTAEANEVTCAGTAAPSNIAELHVARDLLALAKYQLALLCVNPTVISLEAGTWQLQSYLTKQAEYSQLLDLGQVRGFKLTEVFHTFKVIYPVTTALDELELRFQILLYTALEAGDVLQIIAPDGYDFSGNSTGSCGKYRRFSTNPFPVPECQSRTIRFSLEQGLGLLDLPGSTERLTPLLDFSVATLYPRKTLGLQATVFYGEQLRGNVVFSAKSVPGQVVMPRLLELSVSRMDQQVTMTSHSTLRLTFRVSQDADALRITTQVQDISQDEELRFDFSVANVLEPAEVQVTRTNASMVLEMPMVQGSAYAVTLADVKNPPTPGTALWTLSTFVLVDGVLDETNQRDRSVNVLGPVTLIRLNLQADIADPFFDMVNTELSVSFSSLRGISAGQFLELRAPQGFSFLQRSFSPGEGFPLISGQVFLDDASSADPDVPLSSRASLVVQTLTPLIVGQTMRFAVRLRTPPAPEDLALWQETHQSSWLLRSCRDRPCQDVTASNDDLFPGFVLKASFGAAQVIPEANGVAPQLEVTVTVTINPKASLSSLLQDGTVFLRIRAPLGFDFAVSCLAVTPNRVFERCEGDGRLAVLLARDGQLAAGFTSVALFVTNAAMTPSTSAGGVGNTWVLESFVDLANSSQVMLAPNSQARQRSQVAGYEIRELLEATIGGNSQRASVTTVFVWFLASQFLDVGGAVQLHAPPSYELRCTPRVQYISLPAGSCKLLAGVTSSTGDVYHQYLSLALTLPGQQVYPNTAYEFGVAATNPAGAILPNYWGLVLLKPGSEIVDSTRTLPGYELTDFQLVVQAPLPSSTRPSVVNLVQLDITLARQLQPGEAAHVTILAPTTSKVLCQRFNDVTGGGNLAAAFPLDSTVGTYGTHTCQLQNSLTMHLDINRPVPAGRYSIQLGVLNPSMRAAKDYWAVELIKEVADWRTAPAVLQVQVNGFGVSEPFVTDITAVAGKGFQATGISVMHLLMLYIAAG